MCCVLMMNLGTWFSLQQPFNGIPNLLDWSYCFQSQSRPAITTELLNNKEIDFVASLHCDTWPSAAEEWPHRHRPSGWPTPDLIQEVMSHGCELVPVGNPESQTPRPWMADIFITRWENTYEVIYCNTSPVLLSSKADTVLFDQTVHYWRSGLVPHEDGPDACDRTNRSCWMEKR